MPRRLLFTLKDLIHIRQTLLELDCNISAENDHLGIYKPQIQFDAGLKQLKTSH